MQDELKEELAKENPFAKEIATKIKATKRAQA